MTIKQIFNEAVLLKASDIHLANNMPPVYRIDGKLEVIKKFPVINKEIFLNLIKSLVTDKQQEHFFKKKNLEFSHQIDNNIRFRISIYLEKNNIALAARLLWPDIPSFEEVNMPNIGYKLAEAKDGLILVTGPTGCGKSTTLAAIIDYINNNRACHIMTLEDPIEFIFKSKKSIISQRELGKDMISFRSALKHIVRQDPDVILVSEMRDLETVALAITLAETGHLILATLHTPNAPQTIDRIIDIFPSEQQKQIRMQIAMSLKGIISQHLLPKKEKGLMSVREILINTPAVSTLIRENKTAQIRSIMQTSAKDGMQTLESELKKLYRDGLIDLNTALANANYPEEILKE